MPKAKKDKVYIGVKLTRDEFDEVKKMQEEAAKNGLRLTIKEILDRAFEIGLEQAEKELEEEDRKRNKSKKEKPKNSKK